MSKYDYSKASPEFPSGTAQKIKTSLKIYIFGEAILHKSKEKIFAKVYDEINAFFAVFDQKNPAEAAQSKMYYNEILQYAIKCYDMSQQIVGNLSPYLFGRMLGGEMANDKEKQQLYADAVKSGRISKESDIKILKSPNESGFDQVGLILNQPAEEEISKSVKNNFIKDYGYSRATSADTYYKDIQAEIKKFMTTYEEYKQTKNYLINVNPRSIAEMNIRYERYVTDKKRLINEGVTLVYIPPHANCSKRCQPYQGRVYSLDGTSGTIDGRKYIPIEDVADNVTVQGKMDPSRTYFAGLFSYNCRHTMEVYHDGQNIEIIPQDVVERQRNIEEHQRSLERQIRSQREKWALYNQAWKSTGNKEVHQLSIAEHKKAIKMAKQYESFCRKNNIPIYRERLSIVAGEDIYGRHGGKSPIPMNPVTTEIKVEPVVDPIAEINVDSKYNPFTGAIIDGTETLDDFPSAYDYAKTMIDFKPFDNKDDAVKYLKGFTDGGFTELDSLSLSACNVMARTITYVKDAFDMKKFAAISGVKDKSGVLGWMRFLGWHGGKRGSDLDCEFALNNRYYDTEEHEQQEEQHIIEMDEKINGNIDSRISWHLSCRRNSKAWVRDYNVLLGLKKSGRHNVGLKGELAFSTTIHEMGHMLDFTSFKEKYESYGLNITKSRKEFATGVSGYATTDVDEYIAESFAAWFIGERDNLDPNVVKMFEGECKWKKK